MTIWPGTVTAVDVQGTLQDFYHGASTTFSQPRKAVLVVGGPPIKNATGRPISI